MKYQSFMESVGVHSDYCGSLWLEETWGLGGYIIIYRQDTYLYDSSKDYNPSFIS